MLDTRDSRFIKPHGMSGGVYRVRSHVHALLYVGVGWDPEARIRRHRAEKEWWGEVDESKTSVEWFARYCDAENAEAVAISEERPIHNVRSPSVRHPSAPSVNLPEVTIGQMRANMGETIGRVRLLRETTLLTHRSQPVAAVVPAELALLIAQAGGAGEAERVLMAHVARLD